MIQIIKTIINWFAQMLKDPEVQKLLVKALNIFLDAIADKARKKSKSESINENL